MKQTISPFRLAVHGWAFSDAKLLEGKIRRGADLATTDEERATLAAMRGALVQEQARRP